MLENYFPVLLFIAIALAFGGILIAAGTVLGPNRPDSEKLSPYECGFEAFEDARMKFDVRYYLVAILFILFDLEIAFLFPWAVALGKIGFHAYLNYLKRRSVISTKAPYVFRHAAHYQMPNGKILLASYHPSNQNTNTGKLNRQMFVEIFQEARRLADH